MYCGNCGNDLDVYYDDSGFKYTDTCPDCVAEIYSDGIKLGFKLAGGDIDDLAEAMSEHKDRSIVV